MRVGLISDTHGRLRNDVFRMFEGVDHILHAGDIGGPDILSALEAIAPVDAVCGNTDDLGMRQYARERVVRELDGRSIVVIHGHQFGSPTPAALAAAFPDADVILYGHTHRPLVQRVSRILIVNPGAAGPPRFGLEPSVGLLFIEADDIRAEIISL
jgi:putative phosphoesterase